VDKVEEGAVIMECFQLVSDIYLYEIMSINITSTSTFFFSLFSFDFFLLPFFQFNLIIFYCSFFSTFFGFCSKMTLVCRRDVKHLDFFFSLFSFDFFLLPFFQFNLIIFLLIVL
jgi:hypothetical protein